MLMEESVVYFISCSNSTKPFGRRTSGKENQLIVTSIICTENGRLVLFSLVVCCQAWPSLCCKHVLVYKGLVFVHGRYALVQSMGVQYLTRMTALLSWLLEEVSKVAQVSCRMEWIRVKGSDLPLKR